MEPKRREVSMESVPRRKGGGRGWRPPATVIIHPRLIWFRSRDKREDASASRAAGNSGAGWTRKESGADAKDNGSQPIDRSAEAFVRLRFVPLSDLTTTARNRAATVRTDFVWTPTPLRSWGSWENIARSRRYNPPTSLVCPRILRLIW